jgi:hypothetical protein
MEARLLDRNNYSAKTNETYEILSAYYVDIFYNHLYTEATKLKVQSSVSSITEGYKHTLNAFLKGLNNPKLYKKSLISIHNYFISIGLASITFTRCVDKITTEFIPTDYFDSLTSTQKMGVLRMVINQAIKQFIKKIVDEHMVKIIDNHKDRDNVRILQDTLIDCFIMEREGMYQRFITNQTKTNSGSSINLLVAEKMQIEIKKLVKEKYAYKKQINLLTKAYNIQKLNEKKNQEIITGLKRQLCSRLNMDNGKLPFNTYNEDNNHKQYQNLHKLNKPNNTFTHLSKNNHEFNKSIYVENNQSENNQSENNQSERVSVIHERIPHKKTEHLIQPTCIENSDTSESTKPVVNLDEPLSPTQSENFIEVNLSNMDSVINGDSDEFLQQLSDSSIFNDKMDEETTLDDFNN